MAKGSKWVEARTSKSCVCIAAMHEWLNALDLRGHPMVCPHPAHSLTNRWMHYSNVSLTACMFDTD